jgi:AcrR family transcriptional regulator
MKRAERKAVITLRRKNQILNASNTIFLKNGFDKATTAEIAKTAGISVGTIYNYYRNKYDLLISLIEDRIFNESFLNNKKKLFQSGDHEISYIIEDCLSTGFQNINLMVLVLNEIKRDRILRKEYAKQVITPALSLIEKYLDSFQGKFSNPSLQTKIQAHVFLSIMIGLSILYRIEGKKGLLSNLSCQQIVAEIRKIVQYIIDSDQPDREVQAFPVE